MTNFDGYFITNNLGSDRLRCTLYLYYTVAWILCQVPFIFLLYFIEIVFLLCFQNLLRLLFGFVWLCLALFGFVWLCLALFGFVWLCLALFSKFAPLRSQILKRGSFDLFVRISAMQIIGSFQIVTDVTSVVPTFLSCIALLFFYFCCSSFCFALLVRLCFGVFRSCGSDHGLCPLDSHKPLKRLDRNFKCFGAVTFAWFSWFCAVLPPRLLSLGSHFLGRVQIKK